MKYKNIYILVASWVFLFIYLQVFFKYHFYFIEQNQLFLFDTDYLYNTISEPGGLSTLAGDFLLQFFIYPYTGAIIVASLLFLTSILATAISKKISPSVNMPLLYMLPALALLPMIYNFNYILGGSISFILCLCTFYIYLSIIPLKWKLTYSVAVIPVLFYLAGPVSILFAFGILLKEITGNPRKSIWFLLPLLEAFLISFLFVCIGAVGEYKLAILPDLYFHPLLKPAAEIYFSWISFLLLIIVSWLLRNRKNLTGYREIANISAQSLIIFFLAWYGYNKYSVQNSMKYKQIIYYSRTNQWDEIININHGEINNYLHLCYLNMALARKSELADRAFSFDQKGSEGVLVNWNRTHFVSQLHSEVYFTFGMIAAAQELAFETNVSSLKANCGYMLQRLIQTNLILKEYAVAEKYIDILAKTFYYSSWAEKHRQFLYNDEAIENDPLLGLKRRSLPDKNFLYQPEGILKNLEAIAQKNPEDKTAIHYLGIIYLLSKELEPFGETMDKYYGTEILPTLPVSFQEAKIILMEKQPQDWISAGISEETIQRFRSFEEFIRQNQKRADLREMVRARFKNTYWCYYMFK